ncbi:hypothetical protein N7445_009256 [Penicillium cf. griseofulvum]|nr:hypothetical protein N7445_009256 [Penicillium cf. griseofulvum]
MELFGMTLRGKKKEQRLGRVGSRKFEHVHKNSTQCRLCALTRIALETKDGLLPGFDTTIYYSRILFARYSCRSAFSTPKCSSQDHRDKDSQIHNTYRLRAMTSFAYDPKHTQPLDVIRQFQQRPAYDYYTFPPPQGGEISLLCDQADVNSFANGRRMGERLDFDLAKGWIDTCHAHHEPNKKDGDSHIGKAPRRVINVNSGEIESAHSGCSYAALSYCWGPPGTHQVQLDQETEKDLFSGGIHSQRFRLPQTILDAVTCCKKLAIPYLWVDALCRHQGPSEENKAERMGEDISEIYKNSYLTLICEGRDSQHGLPGVRASGQRQTWMNIGNISVAISKLSVDEAMHGSGWMSRLWTFDEYLQSRCCLIFSSSQVFFKCSHEDRVLCEDTIFETSAFNPMTIEDVDIPPIDEFWTRAYYKFQQRTSLVKYTSLVYEYVKRRVTNPKDWKLGFRSSKLIMEPELGKDYIHELPNKHFAWSLCFEIFNSERRSTPNFPSWSWQGWDLSGSGSGNIYFHSEKLFIDEVVTFYHVKKSLGTNLLKFVPVNTTHESRLSRFFGSPFTNIPSSDILEQLSSEESHNVIAFSTFVVKLCLSSEADGCWELVLPGSKTDFIAQALLNTTESYQVGNMVKCAFVGFLNEIEEDPVELFFIVIREVRDRVSCRVGSCTIDWKDDLIKHAGVLKPEVIYLI